MQYYSIQHSLNKKIVGHSPQIKKIIHSCDIWEDSNFIDRFNYEEININPIISTPVLHSSSNATDLIDVRGEIGFLSKILIKSNLKSILEKKRTSGLQFFKSPVIYQEKIIDDYYILNMYETNNDLLDIKNCRIQYHKKADDYETTYNTNNEYLIFENFENFNSFLNIAITNNEFFFIDKISLKDGIKEDFFMLKNVQGGTKYVVSEKLKKEIEEANCTGVEFQPVELSTKEWLHDGEREKVYGKA
ncbi:MAG: DUF1629 domain-containing protein [Flavobacterium circumlabens]|uniref:imm11 family protein n=1 Tax=Flavobacterium TaxID=237 RepID=UPI0014928B32|nr:DUF1629 domain-containing protein [Flavobacterium sp. CLA17]QSB28031.1 hypothetical protein HAV12_004570 [Flavobacterium sp. CLA17]